MQETYVKDPQDDMYLAMDPNLKIFSSRDPPEAKFECSLKKYIYSKILHTFSQLFKKIADLQARSAEFEYLLFFNS